MIRASFVLSIDGRRKLQSTLSSATALGFDGESFLASLANFTSVPLELITLDVGQTYRSTSAVLAFRVDSRFTLPLDDQRLPDAYAVAGLLSGLTLQQLADLLGPDMAVLGLRILSVSVTGPYITLLAALFPPYAPPSSPFNDPSPSSPLASFSDALAVSADVSHAGSTVGQAALITSFILANMLPMLLVLWLYRRRKRFEIREAKEARAASHRSHLALRRSRGPSQQPGHLAVNEQPFDRSWFDVASSSLHVPEIDFSTDLDEHEQTPPPPPPYAAVESSVATAADNSVATAALKSQCADAQNQANKKVRTPSHRSHITFRRCRPSSQQPGHVAVDEQPLDRSWFDMGATCSMDAQDSAQQDHVAPSAATTASYAATMATLPHASESVPSVHSRVPRAHFEIRRRRPTFKRGQADPFGRGALSHKMSWFNASEASLRLAVESKAKGALGVDAEGEYGASPVASHTPASSKVIQPMDSSSLDDVANATRIWSDVPSAEEEVASRIWSDVPSAEEEPASALTDEYGTDLPPMITHASAESVGPNQTTPTSSSDSHRTELPQTPMVIDASFGDMIRRRSQDLTHVEPNAARSPVTPQSGELLEMLSRANAASERWQRETMPGGSLASLAVGVAETSTPETSAREISVEMPTPMEIPTPMEMPAAEKSAALARARSEAAQSRARARARARASESGEASGAAPRPNVSVNSQQAWLITAMGAASEQDYAPVDIQQDWLSQAIDQIAPDDTYEPETSVAPAPASASPRSLLGRMSPRRNSREIVGMGTPPGSMRSFRGATNSPGSTLQQQQPSPSPGLPQLSLPPSVPVPVDGPVRRTPSWPRRMAMATPRALSFPRSSRPSTDADAEPRPEHMYL